jgi:hypothetical protein
VSGVRVSSGTGLLLKEYPQRRKMLRVMASSIPKWKLDDM